MDAQVQEQDVRFGNAVRTRRTQLGVTLDQLAETSGVSAAALSRVERGLLSPTLRNAIAIARGLGLELAELVERDNAKITRAGENLRFFDDVTGIERLTLARPTPDLELLSYSVPPRATSNRFAPHKPGTREIFHILTGRLEVHAGQEVMTLEAGDTATFLVDTEHWFSNVGEQPVRIILTILGP
ncbi:conserved hypothetical protein [Bosea sp. 62]|uniref:helix-turn-helix domain-containing protein n=1 Tax=unclassified Bosea (in: a-proteobacteria) TaxID=2653178 RepID=UPI001256439B|nr:MULTISPECIES: XRE family transcriptional regulator [unclassified Bosea (in: a-proteobacteria)]CAD5249265.1 conserved hypothetical protein [Bosea sp. 46]CAD5250208.1 conserved hypothetical protein [Bosea sp. 21B]CAD5265335.1 conserved hypothetical protein [Bosea sp. 7B]VVT44472.1 conserved hypothetical protein [Bosea sp. EC-HK365B]VXB08120.1 conserved hypothetical protein [Bosea sp. 29B]